MRGVEAGTDGCALAFACMGVSVLCVKNTSLVSLAAHYHTFASRHARDNIIADISLNSFGDVLDSYPVCGESDGLWSSIYLSALAFEYTVNPSEDVRQEAWRVFSGLELLNRYVPGMLLLTKKFLMCMSLDICKD